MYRRQAIIQTLKHPFNPKCNFKYRAIAGNLVVFINAQRKPKNIHTLEKYLEWRWKEPKVIVIG